MTTRKCALCGETHIDAHGRCRDCGHLDERLATKRKSADRGDRRKRDKQRKRKQNRK